SDRSLRDVGDVGSFRGTWGHSGFPHETLNDAVSRSRRATVPVPPTTAGGTGWTASSVPSSRRRQLFQARVHYGKGVLALDIAHVRQSQHAAELVGRYVLHRPGRIRRAQLRLEEGGRACRVENDGPFHV